MNDRHYPFGVAVILFLGLTATAGAAFASGFGASDLPQEGPPVDLNLIKSKAEDLLFDADNDGQFDPGDRVRFLLAYENSGTAAASQIVIVDDYDEDLVTVGQITQGGLDNGDVIQWSLPSLGPGEGGELAYVITLRPSLVPGSYKLANMAAISAENAEPVEVSVLHEVTVEATATTVPTSTPVPTETPKPQETALPTATAAPSVQSVGASIPAGNPTFYWIMAVLIAILELGGLGVIAVIATWGAFDPDERSRVIRVAIVVTMVVGAVLIMGIFGGIERGAAAGILGTIAGYLLRGIREQ